MARNVAQHLTKRLGVTSDVVMVHINHIAPHEKNALIYSKELDEGDERFLMLKESIKQDGLMHNLLVKKVDNGYVCISGHRRLRVLNDLVKNEKLTKFSDVPVKIINPSNEQEEEMVMILANLTQRDQTSAERYEEIKRLEKLMEKDEQGRWALKDILASIVGGNVGYVHEILSLEDKLGTQWVEAFKEGLFAPYLINELSKLSEDQRNHVYRYVSKGNKLTPNILKSVVLEFENIKMKDTSNEPEDDDKHNDSNKYIGDVLRLLRKNKGLSLKQLAGVVGVLDKSLGNYELNKSVPFNSTKKKLADFFGVSIDYLEGTADDLINDVDETEIKDAQEIDVVGTVDVYGKYIKDVRASLKKAFDLMEKIDVEKKQLDALEKLIIYMNDVPLEKL